MIIIIICLGHVESSFLLYFGRLFFVSLVGNNKMLLRHTVFFSFVFILSLFKSIFPLELNSKPNKPLCINFIIILLFSAAKANGAQGPFPGLKRDVSLLPAGKYFASSSLF